MASPKPRYPFHDTDVAANFELSDEFIEEAEKVIENDDSHMSDFKRDKFLAEAARNWDLFYKRNSANFFKDRQWIKKEFDELNEGEKFQFFPSPSESPPNSPPLSVPPQSAPLLIEIGCGVGNSLLPILKVNHQMKAIGVDCSPRAISLMEERWAGIVVSAEDGPLYGPEAGRAERLRGITWDITQGEVPTNLLPPGEADGILLVFLLSAIDPAHHQAVITSCLKLLKPGGRIFFRDYGRYDLAQLRFAKARKSKLKENFYSRYDGTFAYYFSNKELRHLFCDLCGLQEEQNVSQLRKIKNRKTGVEMHRIWLQGKFSLPI